MLWHGVLSPATTILAGGESQRDIATGYAVYAEQCERFLDHWYGGRARRERLKEALVRRSGTTIDPRSGDEDDVGRILLTDDGQVIREESTELASVSYVRKLCSELGVLYASDDLERVYHTRGQIDEATRAIMDRYHSPARGALMARLHLLDQWLPVLRTVGLLVGYSEDTAEITYAVLPPHWFHVDVRPDHHLSTRLAYAVAYVEPEAYDVDGRPIPGTVYSAYVRPALPSDPASAPTRGAWAETGRLVRYRRGSLADGPWPLPDSSTPEGRSAILEDPDEPDGLAEYANPFAAWGGWGPPRSLVWQPLVIHHSEPPVESLRLPIADHLCRMAEEVDCGLSESLSTAALQSYGQPVYKGAGTPPDVVGRRHTVHVLDPAGDYGFAAPGAQTQQHLDAVRTVAQIGASCEDLPYDLLADHPASIETGPAIRLRRHALIQARARRTVDAERPEAERFDIERVLHNALGIGPRIPLETEQRVRWGEIAVPVVWSERLAEMRLERELGLSGLVEQIAERRGVSLDDAKIIADALAAQDEAADSVSPDTALNGAQVVSLLDTVTRAAAGEIPRATAVEVIVTAFPVDRDAAERIVGEIGRGFVAAAKAPVVTGPGVADRETDAESDDL